MVFELPSRNLQVIDPGTMFDLYPEAERYRYSFSSWKTVNYRLSGLAEFERDLLSNTQVGNRQENKVIKCIQRAESFGSVLDDLLNTTEAFTDSQLFPADASD